MTNLPGLLNGHEIAITPLKRGKRADVEVTNANATPAAFASTEIVNQFRLFFSKLEAEADAQRDNPIAMVNALARMEALLADVRYVTDTIRKHTATALNDAKIRRLTVSNVATVEGTSESKRTDWEDQMLMAHMLTVAFGAKRLTSLDSGVTHDMDQLAELILSWVRVQWRLTPIRDAGLDPDNYSTQPTDEDGEPLRTPTVRIHDNAIRNEQVTSHE